MLVTGTYKAEALIPRDTWGPVSPGAMQLPSLRPVWGCPGRGVTTLPLVPSSFWPARQDSVTSLHLLPETEAGLAEPPAQDTPARGPCWEPKARGVLDPPPLAGDPRAMLTPTGQRGGSLGPPEISAAPPAPPRRPRKQPTPRQGAEKVDPRFAGVTLRFQIKPDSSLQIIRSYRWERAGSEGALYAANGNDRDGARGEALQAWARRRPSRTVPGPSCRRGRS